MTWRQFFLGGITEPAEREGAAARLRRWIRIVGLLAALVAWGLVDVRPRGFYDPRHPERHRTDFTVYTEAGAAFYDGRPPYEVRNPRNWGYPYPPLFAMLVAPLAGLPTQDQVTLWYGVSLLIAGGCFYECVRIVRLLRAEEEGTAARYGYWFPWLGTLAVLVALLPTLDCLQRGQVGIVKLYLLLLGLRLVLDGKTMVGWFSGGGVLAASIVLKLTPALPVCLFVFLQVVSVLVSKRRSGRFEAVLSKRLLATTGGLLVGLAGLSLVVPGLLVGWQANQRHLASWASKIFPAVHGEGFQANFGGNPRVARNQSLLNATRRLGNFLAYQRGEGPDDRLLDDGRGIGKPTDKPIVGHAVLVVRLAVLLALLASGIRLGREGDPLGLAAGFALGCVGMLVVSPIAWGHYFMLFAPAVLLVPLWLDRRGMRGPAVVLAAAAPVLTAIHYIFLPWAGRIGLLGLGTTAWLLTAMALMLAAPRRTLQVSSRQAHRDTLRALAVHRKAA